MPGTVLNTKNTSVSRTNKQSSEFMLLCMCEREDTKQISKKVM